MDEKTRNEPNICWEVSKAEEREAAMWAASSDEEEEKEDNAIPPFAPYRGVTATRAQSPLAIAVLEYARDRETDWTSANRLADVAAGHRVALRNLPEDLGPDSPTVKIHRGHRAKRPVYVVRGRRCIWVARGWRMRRESSFRICTEAYELADLASVLLGPSATARIKAAYPGRVNEEE